MSKVSTIKITSNDDLSWDMRCDTLEPQATADRIAQYMYKLAAGCGQASMDVQVQQPTGVYASGTLTLSSVVANDTCVVGLRTYTAKASPSGALQYLVGISDTATATNLAACINADASQADIVTATSSGAVVTVTCTKIGLIGNTIILTGSTDITASATHLASGVNTTPAIVHLGL